MSPHQPPGPSSRAGDLKCAEGVPADYAVATASGPSCGMHSPVFQLALKTTALVVQPSLAAFVALVFTRCRYRHCNPQLTALVPLHSCH